ncbi:MAG: hypothetical protein IKE75_04825 [Bacilli bacterium]|nr:hypothetical protein [Bacilli bacterium]
MKENNLFKFATKETTQDSLFSWIINFYNTSDNELYKSFARDFLKTIAPKEIADKINDIKSVDITRQFYGIDILLILNMKNNQQYYLIIENKTDGELRPQQSKTILYYTKLIYLMRNDKDKFKELSIDVDTVNREYNDKVFATLIRTSIRNNNNEDIDKIKNDINSLTKNDVEYAYYQTSKDYIEKLSINQFLQKHIKFMNTSEELTKIVEVVNKYKSLDKIIEDYYRSISFNLSNESMLEKDENNVDYIIEKGYLVENKTHFRTNKLCFKCFSNELTTKDFDKINNQEISIKLDKLNLNFNDDRNLVIVDTLNFKNGNQYDNLLKDNDNIWIEKLTENNKNSAKIRYIFLFTKELDYFRNEYYVFKGLYKFKQYDELNFERVNIWEKCKISDNGIVSIKKKDIENYIKVLEK